MMMKKKGTAFALVVAVFAGIAGIFALSTSVSAASNCWQVDECNFCCRSANGKVICTQRACV